MNKISKKAFKPIDQEEEDLMKSIERDEWQSVKNIDQEREKALKTPHGRRPSSA